MDITIHMTEGSTLVRNTAYGSAWKDTNGRMFVMFFGDDDEVYEITDNEPVEQIDCTIEQTLGSWGPTQEFHRYLLDRSGP